MGLFNPVISWHEPGLLNDRAGQMGPLCNLYEWKAVPIIVPLAEKLNVPKSMSKHTPIKA